MADNPYRTLPDKAFWRRAVQAPAVADVDPVGGFAFTIDAQTKVATAGSCFAQHIARHLQRSGFQYYVAEPGHDVLPPEVRAAYHYGQFSCRYGNIYTARQLIQLVDRAYGRFEPVDDVWHRGACIVDPFRPTIQPTGFASVDELRVDRRHHLAAVRHMLETLNVFVFTLGLTECWRSKADGAVFPLCPGVEGGTFDPEQYEFHNQTVDEVVADLQAFRAALLAVNPRAKLILTVSPVPLAATAEAGQHVLTATTYSKSVLRVAADSLARRFDDVEYFPSYEIITGAFNRGTYFAQDLRNVVEPGVDHVMRLFMKHATTGAVATTPMPAPRNARAVAERIIEVECDEIALDQG